MNKHAFRTAAFAAIVLTLAGSTHADTTSLPNVSVERFVSEQGPISLAMPSQPARETAQPLPPTDASAASNGFDPGHIKLSFAPSTDPLYACACGCGVFEVATASMLPRHEGGMAWIEWDYQDQNRNRHGSHAAPSADNDDKDIRTEFYNFGLQYLFNRSWGVQLEVPVDHRHFSGADGTTDWASIGDIRIKGLYLGFTEDLSLGIDFGVKVPSGNFHHNGADRDTQLGTGSTDLLLGVFYRTSIDKKGVWNFFSQVEGDLPVAWQDGYRPGFEADAAAGVYYSGLRFHGVRIAPLGQLIFFYRTSDGGPNSASPVASGYDRLLLSPGIEVDVHPFSIYANIEIPVWQYFKGDQLSAPALFKVIVSYAF